MSGTGHDPAGSPIPSEPITRDRDPGAHGPGKHEPAEVADELLDTAERLIGDPVTAWVAVKAEVERRIAHRADWGPSVEEGAITERARSEQPEQSSGGAMPTHPDMSIQSRRVPEFDRERATFERHKPELLARAEGQFVAIRGDEVLGPVETYEAALRAGYGRFGVDGPFYVRQVLAEEPVVTVTRDVLPCQA